VVEVDGLFAGAADLNFTANLQLRIAQSSRKNKNNRCHSKQ
jgi:hypothetical protein